MKNKKVLISIVLVLVILVVTINANTAKASVISYRETTESVALWPDSWTDTPVGIVDVDIKSKLYSIGSDIYLEMEYLVPKTVTIHYHDYTAYVEDNFGRETDYGAEDRIQFFSAFSIISQVTLNIDNVKVGERIVYKSDVNTIRNYSSPDLAFHLKTNVLYCETEFFYDHYYGTSTFALVDENFFPFPTREGHRANTWFIFYFDKNLLLQYVNTAPTITLSAPSNNQLLSQVAGYNQLNINGTVSDSGIGDILTVKYTLNNAGGIVKSNNVSPTITANGSNQSFSSSLLIDSSIPNGSYTLNVWAEDDKGGKSEVISRTVVIDKIAPSVPTITVTPTPWANTTAIFSIGGSTDSSSGVAKYQYQLDSGAWTDFDEDVEVIVEGIHVINARAVDNVGNVSLIATDYARLDNTPPTVGNGMDAAVRYTNAADGTMMRFNTTNGADSGGSGYEATYFWCRKGSAAWFLEDQRGIPWSTNNWYIDIPIQGEGSYLTRAYPRDNAENGNVSSYVDERYIVDRQAPNAPTIMLSRSGVGNTDVSLYLLNNGDNGEAGIDYMQFSVDGGAWQTYTGEWTDGNEGSHTVSAKAIDKAGNISSISTTTYDMDTTPPNLILSLIPETDTASATITAIASDSESGVNRIQLPNGAVGYSTALNYSISKNGVYTFYAWDNASNQTTRSITITDISIISVEPSFNNPVIFDSAEEAAKAGYYPDPQFK